MKYACHFYSGIILLLIWIICVDFSFWQKSTQTFFIFLQLFFQGCCNPPYVYILLGISPPKNITLCPKTPWIFGLDFCDLKTT